MPVFVKELSALGSNGCCTLRLPVHIQALETDSDELFCGGFDHASTDLPVAGSSLLYSSVSAPLAQTQASFRD